MEYKREIEKKFVLNGIFGDYLGLAENMLLGLPGKILERGSSKDLFWKGEGRADFTRLRHNTRELTVKVTDKADITDRIEENVVVNDLDTTARLLTLLFGEPINSLTKQYLVMEYQNTILSLYTVEEDKENRIFFEVEASDSNTVDLVANKLFPNKTQEMRSLFAIFTPEVTNEQT